MVVEACGGDALVARSEARIECGVFSQFGEFSARGTPAVDGRPGTRVSVGEFVGGIAHDGAVMGVEVAHVLVEVTAEESVGIPEGEDGGVFGAWVVGERVEVEVV